MKVRYVSLWFIKEKKDFLLNETCFKLIFKLTTGLLLFLFLCFVGIVGRVIVVVSFFIWITFNDNQWFSYVDILWRVLWSL